MDGTIVVSSIVDKLFHPRKALKETLKHNKKEMSLEDLANHLRVEEELRVPDESKDLSISLSFM